MIAFRQPEKSTIGQHASLFPSPLRAVKKRRTHRKTATTTTKDELVSSAEKCAQIGALAGTVRHQHQQHRQELGCRNTPPRESFRKRQRKTPSAHNPAAAAAAALRSGHTVVLLSRPRQNGPLSTTYIT